MFAVIVTLAALLALLVALLAVPLVLTIDAERDDGLRARWRLRWLFGAVEIRGPKDQPARSANVPAEEPAEAPAADSTQAPTPPAAAQRAPRRRRHARIGLAAVRTRGLLQRAARLVIGLLRRVKIRHVHVQASFGFDDPADTGMDYGSLSPLLTMAQAQGLPVRCEPTFEDASLRGVLRGTIEVRPLSVVNTVLAFIVSPPVLRAALAAWRARK
jgi:hypothetical protein